MTNPHTERAITLFRERRELVFIPSGPSAPAVAGLQASEDWELIGDKVRIHRAPRPLEFTPTAALLAARRGMFGLTVLYDHTDSQDRNPPTANPAGEKKVRKKSRTRRADDALQARRLREQTHARKEAKKGRTPGRLGDSPDRPEPARGGDQAAQGGQVRRPDPDSIGADMPPLCDESQSGGLPEEDVHAAGGAALPGLHAGKTGEGGNGPDAATPGEADAPVPAAGATDGAAEAKPRRKPQRTFNVYLRDTGELVGQIKAPDLDAAAAGAPAAFAAQQIDPAQLLIVPPVRESKRVSYDVFAWNPTGPRELVGTIEALPRTAKARLKTIARHELAGALRDRADMEITVLPTPRTTAERDRTYAPKE